jgi:hypothetical protein
VSAGAALYGIVAEGAAGAGYFNVGRMVTQRALRPLGDSGARWFSEMQTRQLINSVPRMGNYAGRTPFMNWLTTLRYAQPGGGEVVLNWWTRTIIHSNPFF